MAKLLIDGGQLGLLFSGGRREILQAFPGRPGRGID